MVRRSPSSTSCASSHVVLSSDSSLGKRGSRAALYTLGHGWSLQGRHGLSLPQAVCAKTCARRARLREPPPQQTGEDPWARFGHGLPVPNGLQRAFWASQGRFFPEDRRSRETDTVGLERATGRNDLRPRRKVTDAGSRYDRISRSSNARASLPPSRPGTLRHGRKRSKRKPSACARAANAGKPMSASTGRMASRSAAACASRTNAERATPAAGPKNASVPSFATAGPPRNRHPNLPRRPSRPSRRTLSKRRACACAEGFDYRGKGVHPAHAPGPDAGRHGARRDRRRRARGGEYCAARQGPAPQDAQQRADRAVGRPEARRRVRPHRDGSRHSPGARHARRDGPLY
jgi:hypothetical protein